MADGDGDGEQIRPQERKRTDTERRHPGRAGPPCPNTSPSWPGPAETQATSPHKAYFSEEKNLARFLPTSLPSLLAAAAAAADDGSGGRVADGGDGLVRGPGAPCGERFIGDDAAVGAAPAGVAPPERVRTAGRAGLPHGRVRPAHLPPPAAVLLPWRLGGHGRRGVGQRRRARQVPRARGRRGAAIITRGARRGPRRRLRARVRRRGAARRARRRHRPARPRPAAAQEPRGERRRWRVGGGGGAGVGRRVRAGPGAAALAGPGAAGAGAGVRRGVQRGGRGGPAGHALPPRRAAHHRAARRRAPQRRGGGVLLGCGHGGVRGRVRGAGAVAPRLPHQPRRHLHPRQEEEEEEGGLIAIDRCST